MTWGSLGTRVLTHPHMGDMIWESPLRILPGLEATKTIMTLLAIHLDILHPRHGEVEHKHRNQHSLL